MPTRSVKAGQNLVSDSGSKKKDSPRMAQMVSWQQAIGILPECLFIADMAIRAIRGWF